MGTLARLELPLLSRRPEGLARPVGSAAHQLPVPSSQLMRQALHTEDVSPLPPLPGCVLTRERASSLTRTCLRPEPGAGSWLWDPLPCPRHTRPRATPPGPPCSPGVGCALPVCSGQARVLESGGTLRPAPTAGSEATHGPRDKGHHFLAMRAQSVFLWGQLPSNGLLQGPAAASPPPNPTRPASPTGL